MARGAMLRALFLCGKTEGKLDNMCREVYDGSREGDIMFFLTILYLIVVGLLGYGAYSFYVLWKTTGLWWFLVFAVISGIGALAILEVMLKKPKK